MKKYFIVFGLLAICIVCLICYQLIIYSDKNLHLVVCDVGQGDALYMRLPNHMDVVVDGGGDPQILDCMSDHMPFWDRKIDVVFLSHGHEDHARGLVGVLSSYEVEYLVTEEDLGQGEVVEELLQTALDHDTEVKYLQEGNTMRLGEMSFRVLWPSEEFVVTTDDTVSSFDANSASLTLLATYGDIDVLLTGDVHEEVVREAVTEYDPEIVKLAHHGSRTGTGGETFVLNKPALAVMSLGENNSYGHPHTEVIQALEQASIPYMRTDKQGSIEIVSDGKKFWVEE